MQLAYLHKDYQERCARFGFSHWDLGGGNDNIVRATVFAGRVVVAELYEDAEEFDPWNDPPEDLDDIAELRFTTRWYDPHQHWIEHRRGPAMELMAYADNHPTLTGKSFDLTKAEARLSDDLERFYVRIDGPNMSEAEAARITQEQFMASDTTYECWAMWKTYQEDAHHWDHIAPWIGIVAYRVRQ